MFKNGKISIAMATYNGEKYLREQLDSILNQTVTFNELIVCDDCSTDETIDILKEYQSKDGRIHIFQNNQNNGFLINFQKALSLCQYEYIALSDQDDIWTPNHLEILLNTIGNKGLAVGNAELMSEDGIRTGILLSYATNLDYVPEDDIEKAYFILFFLSQFHGMTMLLRKSFLDFALPIPERVIFHDRWFGILACLAEMGGINYTYEVVTYYRRFETSISGEKTRVSPLRIMARHIKHASVLQEEENLFNEVVKRLDKTTNHKTQLFVKMAKKYYCNRRNLKGRIVNFFFELRNMKKIYGCNFGEALIYTLKHGL